MCCTGHGNKLDPEMSMEKLYTHCICIWLIKEIVFKPISPSQATGKSAVYDMIIANVNGNKV